MPHRSGEYTGATVRESIVRTWGSLPQERQMPYPCDALLANPDDVLFRGITVAAPAAAVFRWLCQLKIAPYSYDWLDNWGHRSPRRLTPGADQLAVGQRVMRIFTLASFEPGRHLTIRLTRGSAGLFGDIAVTYSVSPKDETTSRLVAKLVIRHPSRLPGRCLRRLLPAGDLVMMRKQLRTLKALAERVH
jgi:hypothetical protein